MACFWNILFCFRTYHYALDISEREVGQTCFRRGVTTRSENGQGRPRQSREGRAVRRVQETARRQVDLSSSCLKHGSKPGLTRTLRLLSCNLRIILHVFYKNCYIYSRNVLHAWRQPEQETRPHKKRHAQSRRKKLGYNCKTQHSRFVDKTLGINVVLVKGLQ